MKMPLKAQIQEKKDAKQQKMINYKLIISAANKYYSSTGHHEEKKKHTWQIKFSLVTIKQRIKLVLRHSLCK